MSGPPIVGIGASAGGLDALQRFVGAIPLESGLAYIIVQHLSPDHDSILDQLLQTRTELPVVHAEDGVRIEADTIYVALAEGDLEIEHDQLKRMPREEKRGINAPIDRFFLSLADNHGRNASCVVLSGTGSDGTVGLIAVKAAGGVAVVQDSDGARFPGMPNSAVATGLVDFVLRAEDMPSRLAEIAHHRNKYLSKRTQQELHKEIEAGLPEIVSLLTALTGHDFSSYKPGTLIRRIERRMSLRHIRSVATFVELLEREDDEVNRLAQDFLIGVTRFFRDGDTFDILREEVVVPLLASDRQSFRIWVPGCSTGEEAYSIAMIFLEAMKGEGDARRVQVFGTDIDLAALAHARAGIFPAAAEERLTERRRTTFFRAEQGRLRAVPSLREACVFAPHNLLQDPPFSRLDLISCRNLMIYLDSAAQRRLIPRFHFALNPDGALLLGPSEGLAGEDTFFRLIDAKHRLFRRNSDVPTRYSPLADRPPGQKERMIAAPAPAPAISANQDAIEVNRERQADRAFLRSYAAPYALVSRTGEVRYLSERMTAFVKPSRGVPSADIDAFLSPELRVPVRSALVQLTSSSPEGGSGGGGGGGGVDAAVAEEEIRVPNVVVDRDGEPGLIDVVLAPLASDPSLVLLVLNEVRRGADGNLSEALGERDAQDRSLLEREAISLRRQLQMMTAEHETSNQELRSTNEELLSMNEELQSSNEELETSREELQSINEELETVNAELAENNAQLTRANSDLKNLFESTDVAVLFLDNQLCVRSYTPATTDLFGIRTRDQGRPITDLSSRIAYPELEDDAEEVTKTLVSIHREVEIESTGEAFALRMRPYRTTDDRLDGLVLTFYNITERKDTERTLEQNQRDLQRQYTELETLYDTTPVGLSLMDSEMRWLRINEQLAAINGFPVEAHIGVRQSDLIPDIDQQIVDLQAKVLETGEPVLGMEVTGETPAEPGVTRHWITDYYPVGGKEGVFAIGCCVREVTEQKQLLTQVEQSEALLRRTLDNLITFAAVLDAGGTVKEVNRPAVGGSELSYGDVVGKRLWETPWWDTASETRDWLKAAVGKAADGKTVRSEIVMKLGDGERITCDFQLAPSLTNNGEVGEIVVSAFDVTDRKRAEMQLVTLLGELQHRVKNTLATVAAVARFLGDGASDVPEYIERLEARLGAISRTHDILTRTDWNDADFGDIVRAEIAPYENDHPRVVMLGDALSLTPGEALSLGMAIHELATNSVKYGALSVPEGRVEVTVQANGEADWDSMKRSIVWKERGGPHVTPPTRKGFGSFLINQVLSADLNGESQIHYEADGVRCCIAFPDPESGDASDKG